MTKRFWIACGLILAAGCAPKKPPSTTGPVPQPNPQARVTTDVDERVAQMRELTDQLRQVAAKLPAPDDNGQRELMRQVFDLSARLLPLLMGPEADGQFRLQQRIVADSRDQLARTDSRLSLEPTVDSGMRAIYNALVRISQESFYVSESITAGITELRARVDALDTVHGPMHRAAVAQAVMQADAVMERMTHIYEVRLGRRAPEPPAPSPKNPAEQPVPSTK